MKQAVIISDRFNSGREQTAHAVGKEPLRFDSIILSSSISIKPPHSRFLSRPTGGMSPPICQLSAVGGRGRSKDSQGELELSTALELCLSLDPCRGR